MGNYINSADVIIRLIGKVEFTNDPNDVNKMQIPLLNRLISEAEGHVEYDLSPRYANPFVNIAGQAFKIYLLDRPTNDYIRTLCELQSVIRILETDFGRGTVVDSDKYTERLEKRYQTQIDRLLAKKKDGLGWAYPPLPNLQLSYFNTEADDGYMGQVLVTSSGIGSYPLHQINDPATSFFNSTEPHGDIPENRGCD